LQDVPFARVRRRSQPPEYAAPIQPSGMKRMVGEDSARAALGRIAKPSCYASTPHAARARLTATSRRDCRVLAGSVVQNAECSKAGSGMPRPPTSPFCFWRNQRHAKSYTIRHALGGTGEGQFQQWCEVTPPSTPIHAATERHVVPTEQTKRRDRGRREYQPQRERQQISSYAGRLPVRATRRSTARHAAHKAEAGNIDATCQEEPKSPAGTVPPWGRRRKVNPRPHAREASPRCPGTNGETQKEGGAEGGM
jgi:hypothetical protein